MGTRDTHPIAQRWVTGAPSLRPVEFVYAHDAAAAADDEVLLHPLVLARHAALLLLLVAARGRPPCRLATLPR